jgi:hypothetical protein
MIILLFENPSQALTTQNPPPLHPLPPGEGKGVAGQALGEIQVFAGSHHIKPGDLRQFKLNISLDNRRSVF